MLTLGFANAGARDSFVSSGCAEVVHQARSTWSAPTGGSRRSSTRRQARGHAGRHPRRDRADPAPPRRGARRTRGRPARTARRPGRPTTAEPGAGAPEPEPEPSQASAAAREAIEQTRPPGREAPQSRPLAAADADASRDDIDADPDDLGGEDLLARELGASMIEEIKHS